MSDRLADFRQSLKDVRATTVQGIGDGKEAVSTTEMEGLVKQLSEMEEGERTDAINCLRKTDPELRSFLRAYQPIAPAQR